MKKMRIAIIGQGRSGRDIHGAFFLSPENDCVEVVAVVEALEHRRARAKAEFHCPVYVDYRELFGRTDLDLIVNASFSQMHYPITKDLLEHGFSVLVEKPFGRNYYECMDLCRTAKEHSVTVAAFHQTLFTPIFKKIKEIVASGVIGELQQINLKYSGFSRRWDWQTLQCCCAGSLYNSGPHPVGQGLDLIGFPDDVQVVFAEMHRNLTSGDSDDFAKVILKAPGKATIDIEVICTDAFADPNTFKLFGSRGTIVAGGNHYQVKYLIPGENPTRPVIRTPLMREEDGYPMYCSETLITHEEAGKVTGDAFNVAVKDFYHMMYDTILCGKPLTISPEMAAKVISVISTCYQLNPMDVKF